MRKPMRGGLSRRDFSKLALASAVVPSVLPGDIQAGATAEAMVDAATCSPDKANYETAQWQPVFPGILKVSFGKPEKFTPVRLRFREPAHEALHRLPELTKCPISPDRIRAQQTTRGYLLKIDIAANELVYGLGLQLLSFIQRGTEKDGAHQCGPALRHRRYQRAGAVLRNHRRLRRVNRLGALHAFLSGEDDPRGRHAAAGGSVDVRRADWDYARPSAPSKQKRMDISWIEEEPWNPEYQGRGVEFK